MRNSNCVISLMLLSLAALNMPQAAVFCIGNDGHRALELADHHHCPDGSHPANYQATGVEAAEHSHVGQPDDGPCVDIPIPSQSGDRRFASQHSNVIPVPIAVSVSATQTHVAVEVLGVVSPSFLLPSFAGVLPQSVILQV